MSAITFHAQIDKEQVIRPPAGVTLPEGWLEVTVQPAPGPGGDGDALASTRSWLLALAREAEEAKPALPGDLAEQHDHYAHGKPLP